MVVVLHAGERRIKPIIAHVAVQINEPVALVTMWEVPVNCPKCDAEMPVIEYAGIAVNRCSGCNGLWFDLLEHELLKAVKGSEAIDSGDPKLGEKYNRIDRIDCPVCKTQMIRMVDPSQPHIWYESCAHCYGVFFDAGEFRDYKERSVLDFFRDLVAKEHR